MDISVFDLFKIGIDPYFIPIWLRQPDETTLPTEYKMR